jgi:hypothetical protein
LKKTKPNWQAIWLEIAKAYGTPYKNRTYRQKMLSNWGLCWAVDDFGIYHDNFSQLGECMGNHFWWPARIFRGFDPIYDIYRCQFACLMATMSNEEFEELLANAGITYEVI